MIVGSKIFQFSIVGSKIWKKCENTKIWENNVYVFVHLKAHLGEYKRIVLPSHHMGVIEAIYKKIR